MQSVRFHLAYSYCLEKNAYRFYSRLERLISFALLLGAMAAVVAFFPSWLLGLLLAVLAALQTVYRPAAKAEAAKNQMRHYERAWRQAENAEAAAAAWHSAAEADSDIAQCLIYPAYLSALALCGLRGNALLPEAQRQRPMRCSEKLAVWFAGEIPEFKI